MSTTNEVFVRGLEVEEYFCKDDFLHLRQAFPWVIAGFYLVEVNKFATTDAGLLYHMLGHYQCGLCDFKYTPKYDIRKLHQYTLGANCARELKKDAQSLLFIYSDLTEKIYVIGMSLTNVEYDGEDAIITNISQCIIEEKNWPMK